MKNIGASVNAKSTQEKEKNINEEKNKEYEEQTTQYMPENIEEIHISHAMCNAMCTYRVSFYTIGKEAIFEYRDDDGIQSYEVDRKDFMLWLTDEEEKKVLNFEREMREKHIKRMESKKK